jgi:dienelactone hydrolase
MMMQEWFSDGFPLQVPAGTSILDAEMQVPPGAIGLIVLTHAGSRPRFTQRIQNMADYFAREGFGILIMDLLTEEETEIGRQEDEGIGFDYELLIDRLDMSLDWVLDLPEALGLPIGLFGSGPGAWAACSVAAQRPSDIVAVVACGLSLPADSAALKSLRTPTMLIAGDEDGPEQSFAKQCLAAMSCKKRMETVADASKPREDTRVTEKISRLAGLWFEQHVGG